MKKKGYMFLALCMAAMLAGCGADGAARPQNSAANSVSAVLEQQMSGKETEKAGNAEPAGRQESVPAKKETSGPAEVEVDLTALSSTMVYSEVYNMLTVPEDYLGKTVRMSGQFAIYQAVDEDGKPVPDQLYFACIIADATACCQQGLEFILAGEPQFPEGYPDPGTEITVTGEFQTYMEGQYRYCHLVNARLG